MIGPCSEPSYTTLDVDKSTKIVDKSANLWKTSAGIAGTYHQYYGVNTV